MAIEPAIFALMGGEPAPQQRAALLRIGQAAQRQRQRKAHGRRLVAMGAGRHVMQPAACQALRGQVPVKLRQADGPGGTSRPLPLELGMALLKPRNVGAQGLDQGCDMIALLERGDGGASFPAPRKLMCRFHTHD